MKYFPLGRAATKGDGQIRYSLRIPLWPGDNVRIEAIENLASGDAHEITIAGQKVLIEKRDLFLILKVLDLPSIEAAEAMWSQLSIALIRLSAATGAALQFPSPLAKIARGDDPNIQFREKLRESEYPTHWIRRSDTTRTDGGIFPLDAYILPEHERIWEYSLSFGKIARNVNLSQVGDFLFKSRDFPTGVAGDNAIRMASLALWLACTANDPRIQFVLLVTTLDILASDENLSKWTETIRDVISEIQDVIRLKSIGTSDGALTKLSRKINEIGNPGMAERIRNLLHRANGKGPIDATEKKRLTKEVNQLLGKRAAIAHGGKFLDVPTGNEIERLREIVTKALDQRMLDCDV